MESKLRLAIIGAGPGGLILAQLLRDDPDFEVTGYERGAREEDSTASLAGYRILMTPELLDSLRKQLPADVQILLDKAVGLSPPDGNRLGFMDKMCRVICRIDILLMRSMRSVSRWKLRQALLSGMSDVVKFGREFTTYEINDNSSSKCIKASFTNGESVQSDLLVGADGAGSRVRKQLAPNSSRSSTGVTTIYFKAPYTPETEAMIPWASGIMVRCGYKPTGYKYILKLCNQLISYLSTSGNGSTAFYGYRILQRRSKPYGPYDLTKIDPKDSFLMIGVGSYTNEFINQSKHPDEMTPEELKDECLDRVRGWHPLLQALLAITVPKSAFVSHIKTLDPIEPCDTGDLVTILGDAVHR